MSLFNASDRISPVVDRQAAGIRLLPLLYAADVIRLGAASVLDPADVCEDGAAETRRRAGRLVGRDGVFSNDVAGRLCLRPCVEPHAAVSPGRDAPSAAGRCHRDDVADCRCAGMGQRRRRMVRRSGCSACLRSRSAFHSSRCRPARLCCKAGLPRVGTGRRAIPTCSTPRPISARLPRCSPIPSSSSRS